MKKENVANVIMQSGEDETRWDWIERLRCSLVIHLKMGEPFQGAQS